MEIQFLGQGLGSESPNSVGKHLENLISDEGFHSFTAISAFISQSGISGLSKHLDVANHLEKITIIVGVDQKGTSKEALEILLSLGVRAFIFYNPTRSSTFHPKIYFFEGQKKSAIIIGSANLTSQGLHSNVEASILIKFQNTEDNAVLNNFKKYYAEILDFSDPNLEVLNAQLIKELVDVKIVPPEAERKLIHDNSEKKILKKVKKNLAKKFPKRIISKIPKTYRKTRKTTKKKQKKRA